MTIWKFILHWLFAVCAIYLVFSAIAGGLVFYEWQDKYLSTWKILMGSMVLILLSGIIDFDRPNEKY